MYKVIAIVGPSGSGKDTLLKKINEFRKIHKIIGYTTRPIREGEVDGVDYHFISPIDFAEKVLSFEMIEATSFNNWFYGTGLSDLKDDVVNVGVFNPEAAEILRSCQFIDLTIYYLKVSDKIRLIRQLNREEDPDVSEIVRRYTTDKNDFENFEGNKDIPYIVLKNDTQEDFKVALECIFETIDGAL